jgi:hypothetical protein
MGDTAFLEVPIEIFSKYITILIYHRIFKACFYDYWSDDWLLDGSSKEQRALLQVPHKEVLL